MVHDRAHRSGMIGSLTRGDGLVALRAALCRTTVLPARRDPVFAVGFRLGGMCPEDSDRPDHRAEAQGHDGERPAEHQQQRVCRAVLLDPRRHRDTEHRHHDSYRKAEREREGEAPAAKERSPLGGLVDHRFMPLMQARTSPEAYQSSAAPARIDSAAPASRILSTAVLIARNAAGVSWLESRPASVFVQTSASPVC